MRDSLIARQTAVFRCNCLYGSAVNSICRWRARLWSNLTTWLISCAGDGFLFALTFPTEMHSESKSPPSCLYVSLNALQRFVKLQTSICIGRRFPARLTLTLLTRPLTIWTLHARNDLWLAGWLAGSLARWLDGWLACWRTANGLCKHMSYLANY